MGVLTGSDGQLKHNNAVVAKCRNWSLTISRNSVETTTLGADDRSYTPGIKGATGSASLFYDPDDTNTVNFLKTIMSNTSESVEFVLDKVNGQKVGGNGFITSISPSVSVGEAQACEIAFQLSGSFDMVF